MPDLQRTLFSVMARDMGVAQMQKGDYSAEERFAAFLLNWADRLAQRGFSGQRFTLPMARADIANYLSLAPETVSRVLRRMIDEKVVAVSRREVEICNREALTRQAAVLLSRA
jgi:CRP/FNR family transcriptional regulator